MTSRFTLLATVALAVLLWAAAPIVPAHADNKNNKSNKNNKKPNSQQNRNQQLNQAQANLQNAQRQVAAAAAQMGAAKREVDHARDKAIDTRYDVVKQNNQAPSLQSTRQLWEEARANLATLSEPILDKLDADPQYQAAVAERDRLREQTLTLKSGTTEQSRVQSEWAQASGRVSQMTKAALLADPRTKAAMEAVSREEADMKSLLEKKEQDIKSDPQLQAATQEIQQAKAALASAQAQYAHGLRQLAQAQANLAAKAAQARNNNNKNNNNRNKNSNKRRR